jgi:hypothetical protein
MLIACILGVFSPLACRLVFKVTSRNSFLITTATIVMHDLTARLALIFVNVGYNVTGVSDRSN